jgi:sugar PTS system EIIA component
MTTVTSPLAGRAIGLAAVPDPVFSGAMVGPGTAIDPGREPSEAVAPVDGVIVSLHPHAFVVVDEQGHGVLVHLGIDTVQLDGAGFTVLVEQGATVAAGTPVVRWDPGEVADGGRSPIIPVCVMDAPKGSVTSALEGGRATTGDVLFSWPA